MPKPKHPKFPSIRTCSIQAMLEYASQMNGKTKQERIQSAIDFALSNITQLNRVPKMRWSKRKKILAALNAIDSIGVTDSLELVSPKQSCQRFASGSINDMKEVATALGFYVYKVDAFVCITRTPMTIKAPEIKSLAEMPVSERGTSSPELPLV